MTTFNDIVDKTIERLSLVPGLSVQTYAEERIRIAVQSTFISVFDAVWWPDYMDWFERTLDGTLGVVTSNLGPTVKRFMDTQAVYRENEDVPLPILPTNINPFNLSGSHVEYIEQRKSSNVPDTNKIIQFWPKTATGNVKIRARMKPAEFTGTETVYLDDELIVLGACWDQIEDDETSPGAAQKFLVKFEARLKQMKEAYNHLPIRLGARRVPYPTRWEE